MKSEEEQNTGDKMLPKGYYHTAVSMSTKKRLDRVRDYMIKTEPDKYDENVGVHKIIVWMLDNITLNV